LFEWTLGIEVFDGDEDGDENGVGEDKDRRGRGERNIIYKGSSLSCHPPMG
jgi:hypothetical protein